jgi:hypothetical protein
VIAAGVLHPHHVIEQQVMSQPRGADQDLAQLADFGVNAVPCGGGSSFNGCHSFSLLGTGIISRADGRQEFRTR